MIEVIKYDTTKYNFRDYLEGCLGKLEDIHKNFDLKPAPFSTGGGVCDPDYDTFYGLIEKVFKEVVHAQYTFKFMWWEFQKNIIKEWFKEASVIQDLPSIKIFPSGHDWLFVDDPHIVNGRKVNRHLETDHPFHHPAFESNFIVPLIDMDKDNGIFVDDKMYACKYGEMIILKGLYHGGYDTNISKNSIVSIDFKGCGWSEYDRDSLDDTMVRKKGKWVKQSELFTIGNYYKLIP